MGNFLRTSALMAAMIVLFALIGGGLYGRTGVMIAFFVAVALNFGSYWFSDRIVLKMYKAKEVDQHEAPQLYRMVDRLRQQAGLPMPKVYVIPNDQPNAFATGRNPSNAAVAVTNGIVRILSPQELEGVIAHELAHIKNRDILTSTIAATLAAAITLLARFGMFAGGDRDRGSLVTNLLMIFLAPLAAMLIQMAISRAREFAADKTGAEICGNPQWLASALQRLQAGTEQIRMDANPATAHMFIVNPFAGGMRGLRTLFSTHPSTEKRVQRLMALTGRR